MTEAIDRHCRTCGALPGEPCQSQSRHRPEVFTHAARREVIQLPRTGLSSYVAYGRDENGWWQQTELDGPKVYGDAAEQVLRAVFPQWLIDAFEADDLS